MIDCDAFYETLINEGIEFFTGVPDSLLKDICACITTRSAPNQHIIAANEGAAVALATGTFLATGRPALVYMQNSGLGNAINPLLSLADPKVYAIPMLLMIGWRGEPGIKDEPQHLKQGEVTRELLNAMDIPNEVLQDDLTVVKSLLQRSITESRPVALIVKKNTFVGRALLPVQDDTDGQKRSSCILTREEAIQIILKQKPDAFIVGTTGMSSREIFEIRENTTGDHSHDFLTVGSMGHCSQIALGIALASPDKQIICIDGDGSALMHMGSLAIIGQAKRSNLTHIILNNGAHDSVGGQPTVGQKIDLPKIAQACGYEKTIRADTDETLHDALTKSPNLIEVIVKTGSRPDLGRPTTTPIENKTAFIEKLRQSR
jgi:phosphonopyruvate decarboxylase